MPYFAESAPLHLGRRYQCCDDAVAGADPSLELAAKTIAESKAATNAARACAKALVKLCAKDPKEFKAKSKGVGLVVIKDGGIPKDAYLGAYCGELYPGWRWFEKVSLF